MTILTCLAVLLLGVFFQNCDSFMNAVDQNQEQQQQTPEGQSPLSFFSIHFEPGTENSQTFQKLEELVGLAEKYKVKLTLQFTPGWAEFIMQNPQALNLLKGWMKNGHEVGAHHHCASIHTAWDGYSNRSEAEILEWRRLRWPDKDPEPYLGDMAAYMAILNRLTFPETVKTTTMCDDEVDIAPNDSIIYNLEGFLTGGLARPMLQVTNGKEVYYMRHKFIGKKDMATVASAKEEYNRIKDGEIFGAVTHLFDYIDDPQLVAEWFKFIAEREPEGQFRMTATEVMKIKLKNCPECRKEPVVCGDDICSREFDESELSCQSDCCDDKDAFFECIGE